MSKQQKFITSHPFRVKRANNLLAESPEKISIFGREAFVEFFLLEDIERLYVYRIKKIKKAWAEAKTDEGKLFRKLQCEKTNYLLYMIRKCIEIMHGKLDDAAYAEVRKAIHEHQLMAAAGNLSRLNTLVRLTENMLKQVDDEALELAKEMRAGKQFMEDLGIHDANVRNYYGLENESEIPKILDVVDVDASVEKSRISKSKPNID